MINKSSKIHSFPAELSCQVQPKSGQLTRLSAKKNRPWLNFFMLRFLCSLSPYLCSSLWWTLVLPGKCKMDEKLSKGSESFTVRCLLIFIQRLEKQTSLRQCLDWCSNVISSFFSCFIDSTKIDLYIFCFISEYNTNIKSASKLCNRSVRGSLTL